MTTQTTRRAQDLLLAQRRANMSHVGQSYPTQFPGGRMTVTRYDARTGWYYGKGGVAWELVDGVMRTPEECRL